MTPDPFDDLRSPSGSLVSLYASRPSPGGFAALLADLLRPVRESASGDRPVEKSVRSDTGRIRRLADRFEGEAAPAYAVFASDLDGIFVVEALSHEVPDVARLGHRPYIRPLRAAARGLRSGVLVADRLVARTFVVSGAVVDEVGPVLEADPVKRDFGGFAGYEEPSARQRAAESSTRIWKEAGQRLLEVHVLRPLDYLAMGAQEEVVDEVARGLHPYLARLPRVTFPAVPGGVSLHMLRAEAAGFDAEMRRDRQAALAGRVADTAWSGGLAVLGLSQALEAANAQAIEALVVAGDFIRPGVFCPGCGHLRRDGETCPVCGERLVVVDDVVAELMEAVIAGGGRAHQIEVASPLDNEGVGALIRFPLAG